jgi:hypothetical protein
MPQIVAAGSEVVKAWQQAPLWKQDFMLRGYHGRPYTFGQYNFALESQ